MQFHVTSGYQNVIIPFVGYTCFLVPTKDEDAYQWLSKKNPKHWSMTFFSGYSVCDMLLNNLCEAFNCTMFEAWDKHHKLIIILCETIRRYLKKKGKSQKSRRHQMEVWGCAMNLEAFTENSKRNNSTYY